MVKVYCLYDKKFVNIENPKIKKTAYNNVILGHCPLCGRAVSKFASESTLRKEGLM